jgi:hypothetical protein
MPMKIVDEIVDDFDIAISALLVADAAAPCAPHRLQRCA